MYSRYNMDRGRRDIMSDADLLHYLRPGPAERRGACGLLLGMAGWTDKPLISRARVSPTNCLMTLPAAITISASFPQPPAFKPFKETYSMCAITSHPLVLSHPLPSKYCHRHIPCSTYYSSDKHLRPCLCLALPLSCVKLCRVKHVPDFALFAGTMSFL